MPCCVKIRNHFFCSRYQCPFQSLILSARMNFFIIVSILKSCTHSCALDTLKLISINLSSIIFFNSLIPLDSSTFQTLTNSINLSFRNSHNSSFIDNSLNIIWARSSWSKLWPLIAWEYVWPHNIEWLTELGNENNGLYFFQPNYPIM